MNNQKKNESYLYYNDYYILLKVSSMILQIQVNIHIKINSLIMEI